MSKESEANKKLLADLKEAMEAEDADIAAAEARRDAAVREANEKESNQ